jgi:Skp family chaperone for outer membrane proteins
MKRIIQRITFFAFLLLICSDNIWAQAFKEKIEAAKVGIITQQLNLTTEQSKTFWPMYNKYTEELETVRKQQREIRKNFQTRSDDQLRKDMDKVIELKEKEIAVEKKYLQEFMKVINVRQVAMLYRADKMFKAMLLKRLAKREGKGMKEDEMLEEIDD